MENQVQRPPVANQPLTPDALVCISMESDAILFLQKQLQRDIQAKSLGWRPLPFTLFELLEIEKLLPEEITNRVMTHAQRKLIGYYCAFYYKQAQDMEDAYLSQLYDEFLTALLEESTLITFLL